MGASRFSRVARRTVTLDLGTAVCTCLALFGLVLFDRRPPVRLSMQATLSPRIPIILTLHYRTPWDDAYVLHNCAQAANAGALMEVHTENLRSAYCGVCRCVRFVPTGCPPPNSTTGSVNHCEKLAFLASQIPPLGEVIYLDSDVVVMRREFFARLAARTRAADFLASYGHDEYRTPRHFGYFNSGVMFVRAIPGANFTDLMPRMYRYQTGYDQSIITGWVYDHYGSGWDTLSWKWHCRNLARYGIDIPPADCFTIHDRNEVTHLLTKLKYRLLDHP